MIRWADRIKEKTIDIQGLPYYHVSYGKNKKTMLIDEHVVEIPDEVPDDQCINFGLPLKDQIYRNIYVPKQVLNPRKDYGRENWSEKDKKGFVDHMWNIRKNGFWMFIKGEKTYIHPLLIFKYNHTDTRSKFIYKYSDLEFFMFWNHCLRSPHCKGMIDFKCRQLGDTQNTLVIIYEFGSRKRGSLNTMQSAINEKNIDRAFDRLTEIHKNMVYYFKPIHQGSEDAKSGKLVFKYPIELNTHKRMRDKASKGESLVATSAEDYEYPELNSQFHVGVTRANEFDGATDLGRVYLDEFGKPKSGFSPSEWLRVMLEAIYSKITNKKTGMIIMTSTVDEITPETLEESINLYRESNPKKLLSNGSTVNGLFRIFRGVVARGEVDHWGFPLTEKILKETTEIYNAMMESGNIKGALSYIQKNPRTIDDVFVSVNNQSQFHTENLVRRQMQLDTMQPKPYVRGNLKWKDGNRDTEVIWEPNQNGRWEISRHPHDYGLVANMRTVGIGSRKPANSYYFSCGVDPIDQKNTVGSDSEISKGSFCLGRRFDEYVDGGEAKYYQFDDEIRGIQKGDPMDLGAFHETNRAVCTYMERPADPADFFEDLLMTLVYYGSDYLPEKNKSGALLTYMEIRGYGGYLMDKPTAIKNYKGQTEKDGVTMTDKSANSMFDYITTYTCKWANALDHPVLVGQLLTMNIKNKGKKDLGVAFGWMLYAFNNKIQKKPVDKEQEAKGINHWEENYV